MKSLRVFASLLFLSVTFAIQGSAQVNTASLTGLVTDPTGAVIANASVTAKNNSTTLEQSTTTDSSGTYTFASLLVGNYTISVEIQGFKRGVRDSINLEVGQKARIDFPLEVGAVSQSVLVATAPPLLTTQEATTGGVIASRMLA